MEIKKDNKYYKVYLSSVIIDTLLTIFSIGVLIACIINMIDNGFKIYLFLIMMLIVLSVFVTNFIAWKSFYGYSKAPDVLLTTNDKKVIITLHVNHDEVSLNSDDITNVDLICPLICRSGKRILIESKENKYYLDDVSNIDESFNLLKEELKVS